MPESLPYVYTTQAEVDRILSEEGTIMMVDDTGDMHVESSTVEEDSLNEAIYEATDEINFYLLELYNAVDITENRWVRRMCSYLAANILSQRRGNGAKYADKVTAIYERLERIKSGQLEVPRLNRKNLEAPSMSNLVVDNRYAQSKVRVTPGNSVGTRYSGQAGDHSWLW